MARAQSKEIRFVEQIVELLRSPPSRPTHIDIVCDCRVDFNRNPPALPLYIITDGCLLSGTGQECMLVRRLIYEWCDKFLVILHFDCPFWERTEDCSTQIKTSATVPKPRL